MTEFVNVALRHYQGADPQWEAYGINHTIYGCGDTLADARDDAIDAAALLLECDPRDIQVVEYHEHQVRAETDTEPAVWVRTYQDGDAGRMLARRNVRDHIKRYLERHPERMNTFTQGIGAMGDVVAAVMFPDDLLDQLIEQCGDSQRLYVAVPGPQGAIYWQCLSEPGLIQGPGAITLSDLPLDESSTIADFMEVTGAGIEAAGNIVLSAA